MTLWERLRASFRERRDLWILAEILLVGAALRLWRLWDLPAGIRPVEAESGLLSAQLVHGHAFRLFSESGSVALAYLQAPFLWLLGETPLALRLAPALIGVATTAGLFLLVRLIWGTRAALVSSFLLVVSPWQLVFARQADGVTLAPLVMILVLYLYLRGVRDRRLGDFALGGVLLGAGLYVDPSLRVFPWVLFLMIAVVVLRYRSVVRPFVRPMIFSFLLAAAVAGPFFWHELRHPEPLAALLGGDGSWPGLGGILHAVGRTLLMFNVQGDGDFGHNLGGFPLLDPVCGLLFLVGLVYFVSRIAKPTYLFILLWGMVMLVPELVSANAPDAERALGALPAVVIVAGVGGTWAWSRVRAAFPHNRLFQRGLSFVILALAVLSVLFGYERYFRVWAPLPATHAAFAQDLTDMARYQNGLPASVARYAVAEPADTAVIRFLAWGREPQIVLPDQVDSLHLASGHSVVVVEPGHDGALAQLKAANPTGSVSRYRSSFDGKPSFGIFEVTR